MLSEKLMVGLACGLKPEPVMVRRLNDGREVLSSDVITISDPEAIVMDAVPVLVESAALVAVMVTGFVLGRVEGAVYVATCAPVPLVTIVPTAEFPLAMPFTDHVTEVTLVSATAAVITSVPPTGKLAYDGDTRTETAVGTIVTVAEAERLELDWLVTVTVAVFGLGTLAGAV